MKCFRLCLLAFSISLLFAGCQGINPNSPPDALGTTGSSGDASGQAAPPKVTEFVYVANLGSASNPGGSISGFAVDQQTGKLAPVPGSPFPAGDSPIGITSDPAGRHVFVIDKKSPLGGPVCRHVNGILLSENIEPSGKLRLVETITLNGICPSGLTVDPEGKTLYVTEDISNPTGILNGSEIQAFAIQQNGTLKEIAGSPFAAPLGAGSLTMHPDGKLLYVVTGTDHEGIVVFDRDLETGRLGPARPVAARLQAHTAIVPSGKLMIAENAGVIDQITLFSIDPATGGLTPQPPMASSLPWAVSIEPSGQFAALAVASPNFIGFPGEIQIFRIDESTSSMTQFPVSSLPAGRGTFDAKFDPQGKFIYSVATNDNAVMGFAFDRNSGSLAPVTDSAFKTGDTPWALTIARPK